MNRYSVYDAYTSFTPAFSVTKAINDIHRGLLTVNKPQMYCHFRPNQLIRVVDTWNNNGIMCGKHLEDGKLFVAGGEKTTMALYDASSEKHRRIWMTQALGRVPNVNACFRYMDPTSDQNSLILCTANTVQMIRNFRDLDIAVDYKLIPARRQSRCLGEVFSIKTSSNNTILIGASKGFVYEFDMASNQIVRELPVGPRMADVYAVGFVDDSCNLFYTATDQGAIRLWDRRTINVWRPRPIGKLIGHHHAVTNIDSRQNGHHLLSQSYDQSIKLWDLRSMQPSWRRERQTYRGRMSSFQDVNPAYIAGTVRRMRADTSIMTYRGHHTWGTMMRAKFSPAVTTGQRYICTGCASGRVIIYDVLTGAIAERIEGHRNIVVDVFWHPDRQDIITCGVDSSINLYSYVEQDE